MRRSLDEVIAELRLRQARHDERSAARRYAFRLPTSTAGRPFRWPAVVESHVIDVDVALVQVADVVLRLQDTVEVQGALLDRVVEQVLPDRRRALGG